MILVLNGTLMRGFELNKNLIDIDAEFVREDKTASCYRIWSIVDTYPAMQKDNKQGCSISVEIWSLKPKGLLKILESEIPGISLGKVLLADQSVEFGILGENVLCKDQKEITDHGVWKEYIISRKGEL